MKFVPEQIAVVCHKTLSLTFQAFALNASNERLSHLCPQSIVLNHNYSYIFLTKSYFRFLDFL